MRMFVLLTIALAVVGCGNDGGEAVYRACIREMTKATIEAQQLDTFILRLNAVREICLEASGFVPVDLVDEAVITRRREALFRQGFPVEWIDEAFGCGTKPEKP